MGAEADDNGYHRGMIGHAPFLLKMIKGDPPRDFFKFRRKGVARPAAFTPAQPRDGAWHVAFLLGVGIFEAAKQKEKKVAI